MRAPSSDVRGAVALTGREAVPVLASMSRILARWRLAAMPLVAALVLAGGASVLVPRAYQAQARLFVGQQSITRPDLPYANELTQTSLALVKSYSEAIGSRPIAQRVITLLNLDEDAEDLLERMQADPVGDTQIIRIAVVDRDARRAERIANAFAAAFIADIERIDPSGGELGVRVTVLEPAIRPSSALRPAPVRYMLLALFLGGLVAWASIVVADRLDTRIRSPRAAAHAAGTGIVAAIPSANPPRRVTDGLGMHAEDPLRVLGATLARRRGRGVFAVAGPVGGTGATTAAYALSASLAQSGAPTVLIEADVWTSKLSLDLGLKSTTGLSGYLTNGSERCLERTALENLAAVGAGQFVDGATSEFGGERMRSLLDTLAEHADAVIVDVPPVLESPEARDLLQHVDGVLVVARCGYTRREDLAVAVEAIGQAGGAVIGVVVLGASGPEPSG